MEKIPKFNKRRAFDKTVESRKNFKINKFWAYVYSESTVSAKVQIQVSIHRPSDFFLAESGLQLGVGHEMVFRKILIFNSIFFWHRSTAQNLSFASTGCLLV